jgi:chemotaxis protein histidine kinase CheA
MTVAFIQKYKTLFISTSYDLIDTMINNIHKLKETTDEHEPIYTLHRMAHSLKGQSLAMNYTQIAETSKLIEYIFRDIETHLIAISPELIETVGEVVIKIKSAVLHLEQNEEEIPLTKEQQKLNKFLNKNI